MGGRLDLTQAEALRDLVDSETESQRRVALRASKVHFSTVHHAIIIIITKNTYFYASE